MPDVVLVAGGAGALGEAVVGELSGRGWAVTVIDRHEHRGRVAAGVGYVQADLLDAESAARAVDSIDGLAAVVDLVGGFAMGAKVGEADPDEFEFMLRLNLLPAFNLARAAMPRLVERGGGSFVAVSARAAVEPFAGASAYITAKAAVLAFVRALDADYRADGIRANAILPSVIDTPANRETSPDADWTLWVPPEQIACVIAHLCSDDSRPTSGAAIPVYGRA